MSLLPSRYAIRLLSAFCIAFIALTASASAQVKDHLNIPGPISFGGQSYELAWSSHPSTNYIKQEYLPKAQTVERYSEMLLVELLKGNLKVADAVGAQMQKLNTRKGTDPIVKMAVVKNDATGEMLLDFLMSDKDKNGEIVVEWNAYRYARVTNAKGEAGIGLFGVSRRAYGNDNAKAFLGALKALRPAQIKQLAKAASPFAAK